MSTSGDIYGEEEDTGSSKSQEEHNDPASPMRNLQDDPKPRHGSQRLAKKVEKTKKKLHKYTDQQQAELFRKLDSIKGHLLHGAGNVNVVDQPQMGGFHGHGHGHGPSYYNPYPYGMFPTPTNPNHVPGYGYPMPMRPQNWYPGPGHYPNQMPPPHPQYPPGQYVDIGSDILEPQLQDPRFFPGTPSRYNDVPCSPVSHHGEKIGPFSPQGGVQGHRHTRRPSETDSDMGGVGVVGGGAFAHGYVKKPVPDSDSRSCHPLAGGAPFVACHNCFELLYLPKKKLLAQEKQQKLQCGACSEVISFTIVDKKLVFSSAAIAETTNLVTVEVEDISETSAVVDDCPITDGEPRKQQDTKIVLPSLSEKTSDSEETSSISSEPRKEVAMSVRRRAKGAKAPPPPPPDNTNLLELFEYSNVHRAALNYGMAQLGYNKQESYAKQDSLKLESVATTETEVSYNEGYYNNTDVSEDSRMSTTSREENKPRNRRKESSEYSSSEVTYQTISNDDQNNELEVWVNGHLIPEDLVISAEKQAGPVQAGNYWYDYRAGFWGVMGNPCLGIIPPFIEEFSRPMPDNCGAGNTSVFVNGRELHERDLELLSRRGLPRGKNRSYIVDISGRVLDGDSGEELKSLGKLAPTIEKVKHGFGMRVPRSLAS